MTADLTYQTKNYEAQGGDKWVIGGTLEIEPGATVTGLAAVVEQTALADLTENGGAIGGSNDGDLPDLTATAAPLTGTLTGTTDGALADIAATAGSCGGGATPAASNVDTAIATAVASIVSGVNTQNKEMQAQINALIADNVALRAAVRENSAKENAVLGKLRDADVIAT